MISCGFNDSFLSLCIEFPCIFINIPECNNWLNVPLRFSYMKRASFSFKMTENIASTSPFLK